MVKNWHNMSVNCLKTNSVNCYDDFISWRGVDFPWLISTEKKMIRPAQWHDDTLNNTMALTGAFAQQREELHHYYEVLREKNYRAVIRGRIGDFTVHSSWCEKYLTYSRIKWKTNLPRNNLTLLVDHAAMVTPTEA